MKYKLFLTIIFLIFLEGCDIDVSLNMNLGDGYELERINLEDYKIVKGKKIFVPATIVDVDYTDEFIAGLKLERQKVECLNIETHRVVNERRYFIFNKSDQNLQILQSKKQFIQALKKVKIFDQVVIDYDKFDQVWTHLNSIYQNPNSAFDQSCKIIN